MVEQTAEVRDETIESDLGTSSSERTIESEMLRLSAQHIRLRSGDLSTSLHAHLLSAPNLIAA